MTIEFPISVSTEFVCFCQDYKLRGLSAMDCVVRKGYISETVFWPLLNELEDKKKFLGENKRLDKWLNWLRDISKNVSKPIAIEQKTNLPLDLVFASLVTNSRLK